MTRPVPTSRSLIAADPRTVLFLGIFLAVAPVQALAQEARHKGKPASAWITDLEAPEPRVRQQALEAVAALGPQAAAAVPRLIPLLTDKNATLQGHALTALEKIGPAARAAVPALLEVLAGKDVQLRTAAARALGAIGAADKSVASGLLAALQDGNRLAAELLRNPGLAFSREGPTNAFLEAVLRALAKLGPAAKEALPAAAVSLRSGYATVSFAAADALAAIGSDALPVLADALNAKDHHVRYVALKGLGALGSVAVPVLLTGLRDENPTIRENTALFLGRLGPEGVAAVPALVEALQSKSGTTPAAADALARIGPDALPFLTRTLRSKHWPASLYAAKALQQLGPQARSALPDLVEVFHDGMPSDTYHAVQAALVALGADAVPFLADALRDADKSTYGHLVNTLLRIEPAARMAVPVLLDALKDDVPANPKAAANPDLSRWDSPRRHALHALRSFGAEIVPDLVQALDDKAKRKAVGRLLEEIGPRAAAAVPALLGALDDPEAERHQLVSTVALGVGSGAAAPAFLKLLDDLDLDWRKQAAATLGAIGPEAKAAVPALTGALRSPYAELRRQAALALRGIGPAARSALPALKTALQDDCGTVRAAATEALIRIQLGK